MMIIVVGIYLLLLTPFALTCPALLIMRDVNPFIDAVQNISLSIGMFNSSMNFLIYYACNMKFRRAFKIMYKMQAVEATTSMVSTTSRETSISTINTRI